MDSTGTENIKKLVILSSTSDSLLHKLRYLKEQLASSYGPFGRTKIVALSDQVLKCGSSSTLLLNSELTHVDNNIIKLIISSAKEHLRNHHDFGLYCLIFSLSLVEWSLKIDVSSCLIADCFRQFLEVISSHLQDVSSCPIIKQIDISNSKSLLLLVRSIIMSKPCLLLNESTISLLCRLLLQSFVVCLPNDFKIEKIVWPSLLFVKNSNVEESIVFEGVLLDLVHYSQEYINNLLIGGTLKQRTCVVSLNMSLTVNDVLQNLPGKSQLISQSRIDSVTKLFQQFSHKLRALNISVVFNQKLISDEVKCILKSNSIICIDRIGLCQMEALKRVTKCKVMSTFVENIEKCKGFIDELTIVTIKTKSFVGIKRSNVCISTAVLCYANPVFLDDLKHVCWAAINALDKTIKSQLAVVGGSAMENYLITYLEEFSKMNTFPKTIGYFSCSMSQWQMCSEAFCSALKFMKNMWVDKPKVAFNSFDCYVSKINAFTVAIETACIALEIKYQIHD